MSRWPILVINPIRCRPLVLCSFEMQPIHAANSRPLRNCFISPANVRIAYAVTGPIQGTVSRRRAAVEPFTQSLISRESVWILVVSVVMDSNRGSNAIHARSGIRRDRLSTISRGRITLEGPFETTTPNSTSMPRIALANCVRFRTSSYLARKTIFRYIEEFYNRRQRHSARGYQSPMNFETDELGMAAG